MSLVKKYLLSNVYYKNIYACSFLFYDNKFFRANCPRHYTCLNGSNPKAQFLKCQTLEEHNRKSSVYQFVKEKNYMLTEKAKELYDYANALIPTRRFKYQQMGFLWYGTLDEIYVEDFFELFQMVDSFYSRFKIIELHVWMLLYHLPREGRHNEVIRAGLIKAMWEDSEKRAKLLAKYNANHKKNFRDLYGKFLLSELLYDDGFLNSDASLCNAVWCSFFNRINVDPRLLEAMVSYIRYQMSNLNKLNMEELTPKKNKGRIWAPARPHIEAVLKL